MSDQLSPRDEPVADTNFKPGMPAPTAPRAVESVGYQPVSGWAVAGLVVSGFFAILVLASTAVALWQGAPIFFPVWSLSLAIIGIVLSLVGQSHVRNSEGTRTGAKLATIGVWLGVVSGLCYFSYYYATRYAQEMQANDFLMTEAAGHDTGFFHHLRKGGANPTELNTAFLLTRPITARSGNPNDPKSMSLNNDSPGKDGKGELTSFKESIMPRVLYKKLGEDAEITPLAVQLWKYEKKSYQITRMYLIKTKEVELEMILTVASVEPEASGMGRKWFLNLQESGPDKPGEETRYLTRYGKGIQLLRFRAREWLEQKWLPQLNRGEPFNALKDIDQTPWKDLIVQDQKPKDMRASLYRLFESTKKDRLSGLFKITTPHYEVGRWELHEGKIRMVLNFRVTLLSDAVPAVPLHDIDGYLTVETRQVIDPEQLTVESPPPDWSLVGITFTNSSRPSGGMSGPPMP